MHLPLKTSVPKWASILTCVRVCVRACVRVCACVHACVRKWEVRPTNRLASEIGVKWEVGLKEEDVGF